MELIHEDKRGRLFKIDIDGQEYLFIETKAGYSRGGDLHKSTQHDVVLKGKILWRETYDGVAETQFYMEEGESNTVGMGIPHMFTSITDSLVLEWLEGPFEKEYYEPFRKIIREKKE